MHIQVTAIAYLHVTEGLEMSSIRAATTQFQHRAGDKVYNLAIIADMTKRAKVGGAQILAFPEMCITGYWHVRNLDRTGLEALAEPVEGRSVSAVRELARANEMLVSVGFLERAADGRLFNSYAICLPDGTVRVHRKLHAFEHEAISSGDSFTVVDTPWGVRVGILICWDNNLIENGRATALLGADILLAPHQTGGCNSPSPHGMKPIDPALWQDRYVAPDKIESEFRGDKGRGWLMRWLPSRAHDNGMFLVFSNGVGEDDGEVRTGNAMILDPYGRILVETWAPRDELLFADLDLDLLPLSTGRRWIRGRRPELYGSLAQALGHEIGPRAARFSSAPVVRPGRADG
jgi:predicted amidohydrolase